MKPTSKQSVIFAILTSASSLQAASVMLEGDFAGTFLSVSSNYQGIPSLVGSFRVTYDDTPIPSSGFFTMESVPLSLLTLAPSTIGSTGFNPVNTAARIQFQDGVMTRLEVGGIHTNAVNIVLESDNDFRVTYNLSSGTVGGVISASNISLSQVGTFTGNLSQVPEPSVTFMITLAAVGIISRRRK